MAPPRPSTRAAPVAFPVRDVLRARPETWLGLALASGGDERLWRDPASGRDRYGVPAGVAADEIWFSSSTASALSSRGHAAAADALAGLGAGAMSPADLVDHIRARLLALYAPPGAEAVLSASGTELELLALSLVRSLAPGPLTNLVVAPAETGSGVPLAAEGRHFLGSAPFEPVVPRAERLGGLQDADIVVRSIAIRAPDGSARPPIELDVEAETLARQALGQGRSVLLHVLDCSKTGLSGVSREAARRILALDPQRVAVLVDACQLRCEATRLRADLEDGFAVAITGSKFAGGPAFCGALLTPPDWRARLADGLSLPHGLAACSARLDWPPAWRETAGAALQAPFNLGLALRWTAALREIEAYEAVTPERRSQIVQAFGGAVAATVGRSARVWRIDQPGAAPSIHLIRADASAEVMAAVWRRIAESGPDGPACHLGQPVAVGEGAVLRVCAGMPLVTDVARRLDAGETLEQAMSIAERDLDIVFRRLDHALAAV